MNDSHFVKGVIKNLDKESHTIVGQMAIFLDTTLTTIALIKKVYNYVLPDDSLQVSIDALGLDFCGAVFDLSIEYFPKTIKERDEVLAELQTDSIWRFKGRYAASSAPITLMEPVYLPVEPDLSMEEIRKVFDFNSRKR
ncbi:hypothetical protein [Desulfobacula sp.]|uniref:hypothetical protein n=1 Tax=Desulfobacula sp. TaxID=2593537 RepID=UPI001EBB7A44|nr:hypothetical protein [Desulfobacula sp.]